MGITLDPPRVEAGKSHKNIVAFIQGRGMVASIRVGKAEREGREQNIVCIHQHLGHLFGCVPCYHVLSWKQHRISNCDDSEQISFESSLHFFITCDFGLYL